MGLPETLTAEIERIISSPYSVSLKKLDDILLQCDAVAIRTWSLLSPCQIPQLVTTVREALQVWPYALRVLQKLAQARSFRDALLLQNSGLLDDLLRKSSGPESSRDVLNTCAMLLADPLPESIPLPSSAQKFFVRIFEEALQATTEQNLSLLHSLLSGACRELLNILPHEQLDYFEDRSYDLLKITENSLNSKFRFFCIGILLPFVEPNFTRITLPTSPLGSIPYSQPERLAPVKALDEVPRIFREGVAHVTVHYLLLGLVNTCIDDRNVFDDETIRSMKVANETLTVIKPEVRHTYARKNGFIVEKLLAKLSRLDNQPMAQLQGLTYIGLLYENHKIPADVVLAYQMALLACTQEPASVLSDTLSLSLPCFTHQLTEDFVGNVLRKSMDAAVMSHSHSAELEGLIIIIQLLSEGALNSRAFRKRLFLSLSAEETKEPLENLLKPSPSSSSALCTRQGICPVGVLNTGRRLCLSMCSLLLKSALATQAGEVGIDLYVGLHILQKQQEVTPQLSPCKHFQAPPQHAPISLVQETCTPQTQSDSYNWRQRLATDLENHGKLEINFIQRRVDDVCRDLEARCENIEEPLHQEQQKVQELRLELQAMHEKSDKLNAHIRQLEAHELDRDLCMEGLETEKAQTEADLQHVTSQKDDLLKQLDNLFHKQGEAENALIKARKEYDQSLSQIRALLTGKEVECLEQTRTLETMQIVIGKLETDLCTTREEVLRERNISEETKEKLAHTIGELEEARAVHLQARSDIESLNRQERDLACQLDSVKTALADANDKAIVCKADHEKIVADRERDIDTLRNRYEEELKKISDEASQSRGRLERRLQALKDELEDQVRQQEAMYKELQVRDTEITKLQQEIEVLSDARDEAEAQLEEAQASRTRMRNAMEAALEPPVRITSGPHVPRTVRIAPVSHSTSRRRTFQETRLNQDSSDHGEHPVSDHARLSPENLIPPSNEPSPKRSKSRQQPFKVPTVKATAGERRRSTRLSQNKSFSTTSPIKRKPLEDVSAERGNLSHVTVAYPPKKTARDLYPEDVEEPREKETTLSFDEMDLSFDASGLLADGSPTQDETNQSDAQPNEDETTG
ncbi:uncharacterized protein K452DRAFT_355693 [Aplosporella prunicola CBS 121167]|uniref:Uncharacterized protein n=1 Tax=Aplosporella prunicola CBS 121167 TaxID=1176127 RepID=A0A6A6BSL4_9PEZI|nr:uncharacterized protein K452DRAFT_355693 [Aplosporella prunicola CBS 121167]KAF2146275.1 hypothetical protein K452DRAFT_355693 [Aplosporella prunicola CBS 121167]